jgi:hypothetical protein
MCRIISVDRTVTIGRIEGPLPSAVRCVLSFLSAVLTHITAANNIAATLFTILFAAVLVYILYGLLKSCLTRRPNDTPMPPRQSGWFPGGFGGGFGGNNEAPPPYTPRDGDPKPSARGEGWRPGFWSGAALGTAATYFANQNNRRGASSGTWRDSREYDWERDRNSYRAPPARAPSSGSRWGGDRGEGSSGLGSMRRSMGFGGSNVR